MSTSSSGEFALLSAKSVLGKFNGPNALNDAIVAAEAHGYCAINYAPKRQVAIVRAALSPPRQSSELSSGVRNGPWEVYTRDQPFHLHVVTNAWHAPRVALIVRHAKQALRITGQNRLASLIHFSLNSSFKTVGDKTKDRHLRDGVILASRVISPGSPHAPFFQACLPTIGPELREVGENMREWARKHLNLLGPMVSTKTYVSHILDQGKKLIAAIKRHERVGAFKILYEALVYCFHLFFTYDGYSLFSISEYSHMLFMNFKSEIICSNSYNLRYPCGDKRLVPLAQTRFKDGWTALHYAVKHNASAIIQVKNFFCCHNQAKFNIRSQFLLVYNALQDLIFFWGADPESKTKDGLTPKQCVDSAPKAFDQAVLQLWPKHTGSAANND